jgi:hypothetical protein
MDPGSAAHRLRAARRPGHVKRDNSWHPIRFAAIAGVHGNDLALEAVIADIRARFADGSWRASFRQVP